MFPLFPLGQIVATPGALAALERAKQSPTCFLARHAIGDWGELEPTDVAENEHSVAHELRLLSSYRTDAGTGCGSSPKQTGRQPRCFCLRSTDRGCPPKLLKESEQPTIVQLR
jgi:hypothetical protein